MIRSHPSNLNFKIYQRKNISIFVVGTSLCASSMSTEQELISAVPVGTRSTLTQIQLGVFNPLFWFSQRGLGFTVLLLLAQGGIMYPVVGRYVQSFAKSGIEAPETIKKNSFKSFLEEKNTLNSI